MTREQADAVELAWQPEVADYFQAFNARNRAGKAWHKIGGVALLGLVFAVLAFGRGRPSLALYGLEVAIMFPVMVPVITWLSTRSVWFRHPALHTPTRAVVHPSTGITTDGPLVDLSSGPLLVIPGPGSVPWPSVERVLETRRVFVVQLTGARGKRFLVLAKRGLTEPAALRQALTRQNSGSDQQ